MQSISIVTSQLERIYYGEEKLELPTRYLSVDTLTRIRSSPMRTFSPSDLCLDAGWMVHQQASPIDPKISFMY